MLWLYFQLVTLPFPLPEAGEDFSETLAGLLAGQPSAQPFTRYSLTVPTSPGGLGGVGALLPDLCLE